MPFIRDQRASVVTLFALALPALVLAVGATVDYTRVASDRVRLQGLADGAALIGLQAAQRSGSQLASAAKSAGESAAQDYVRAGAGSRLESVTAKITASMDEITVTANGKTLLQFGRLLGTDAAKFEAVATAKIAKKPAPICLLALDKTAAPGILFKGSGSFTGDGCVIWSNSTSTSESIYVSGSAKISALAVCAGGQVGYQGAARITPSPTTSCSAFKDPLLNWVPQDISTTCTSPTVTATTLSPGVYCNAINVSGSSVTLQPGVYVIKDHKVNISSNTSVSGTGVQFILMGNASLSVSASADLTLSGITDAQGNKVLVAEYGPVSANATSFSGSSKLDLDGTIHLPSQDVEISGNATVAMSGPASSIIARSITVGGSGAIEYPASSNGDAPQVLPALSEVQITN